MEVIDRMERSVCTMGKRDINCGGVSDMSCGGDEEAGGGDEWYCTSHSAVAKLIISASSQSPKVGQIGTPWIANSQALDTDEALSCLLIEAFIELSSFLERQ